MANSTDDKPMNTDTNMMVSMLANTEKLKPRNQIHHYEDDVREVKLPEEEKIEEYMDDNTLPEIQPKYVEHPPMFPEENPIAEQDNKNNPPNHPDDLDEYDRATPVRKRLLKLNKLRQIADLARRGVKFTENYSIESDYKMMCYEYDLHKLIREKHATVSFMHDGCISSIGALEKLNKRFDPFGFQLDGWCENVTGKSEQLYDAFGNLYEKWWSSGGSLPPEFALVGILGFSAVKTHFINSASSSIPSVEDKVRSDPHYLENIRRQALGNNINDQVVKSNNAYTEKLEKQYANALEDAKMYREMANGNDARIMNQQTMRPPPMPQHNTPPPPINQQPTMSHPTMPTNSIITHPHMYANQMQMEKGLSKMDLSPTEFQTFRETDIQRQKDAFERKLEEQEKISKLRQSNIEEMSHHSVESVVHTNPNIDDIIKEVETMSNASKNEIKETKRKKKKSKNAIKLT